MTSTEALWYIPNQTEPGHRGDAPSADHNALQTLCEHAFALEREGWAGALLGTGWGRPDTFTVAASLLARTTRFEPLIAVRPGYWTPAHFASAAATLDHLSNGRVRINIVSGQDNPQAYGDDLRDSAQRYVRTAEFMHLVRRLWTEQNVTHQGQFYHVAGANVSQRIAVQGARRHPRLYFGGASPAAEAVAAAQADVQLLWGEPLAGVEERIFRLKALSQQLDRDLPPLQFGLRITAVVRDTREEAWAAAERKVARMAADYQPDQHRKSAAVGQQRLLELQSQGEVLDDNLYTTPGKFGGGGAGTTWLVGSPQDVADALLRYQALGVSQFILSDTPYLEEVGRQGRQLLPLLRQGGQAAPAPAESTAAA